MHIEETLKKLPTGPGVYMMRSASGQIIYIGKAKNLKSRVQSYFRETGDTRYAVKFLAAKTADIDFIVTSTEKEALFLEDTLLKKHKPKYNIRLKDSKTYVSIKITMNEQFPRVLVTRQIKKDGSRYFGPYVSTREVRETIKFIRRIFPLCVCSQATFRNRVRPCLDYSMGLCPAPAVGLIAHADYMQLVSGAIMFLEGRNKEIIKLLKERMKQAALALKYEEAGIIRDRINVIEGMLEEQKVVTHRRVDRDVFAIAHADHTSAVQALHIREGRLVSGAAHFYEEAGLPDDEIVSSFLNLFYKGERFIPDEIIVQTKPEDASPLEAYLGEKKGRRCRITVPARGDKLKLLDMAVVNAEEAVKKRIAFASRNSDAITDLQARLRLRRLPEVIEAFDISNLGSSNAVGAMVVFRNGEPDKNSYRRYRINSVEGQDDYAMLREVLTRRYFRDAAEPTYPDLILIDGGKGQLNIALSALKDIGMPANLKIDIASLAKDREPDARERFTAKYKKEEPRSTGERIFLPNVKEPVILKEGSRPDLLLRRIRDEVHRYAISYHRSLRSRAIASALDAVPGIGRKLRLRLLERFGDLNGVIAAPLEELTSIKGVSAEIALLIKQLKE